MCGRYYVELKEDNISKQIIKQIEQTKLPLSFKQGEIFPNDNCLILIAKDDNKIDVSIMKWGFDNNLINARQESLNTKSTFTKIKNNHCIIIANGFYEWKDKLKYYIEKQDEPFIYLAGIYNHKNEFLIITGNSENDMKDIHDRTPIIFNTQEMIAYLHNKQDIKVNNDNLEFKLV